MTSTAISSIASPTLWTASPKKDPTSVSKWWVSVQLGEHGHDGRETHQQQDQCDDQREGGRERTLTVNQSLRPHLLADPAQAPHELEVVDDPEHEHADPDQH